MRYDLNLLPILAVLMEERSVTRAAQRLGMTQAALSNALARLRALLQDPLFIRERYGMRPTAKAEQLAPALAAALATIDAVVLGQQDFDPARADQAFVIAPNSYVEFVLVPALVARLGVLAPGIRLRTVPFGTDLADTGVVSGSTALVLGRVDEAPDNLVVQTVADDGLACVLRADHPAVGARLGKAQYERLKHVNVLPPGRLRAGLFQALARQGLARDVAVSVTHFAAVAEIVAATDYCATLPRLICDRLAADARLKVLSAPVDLGRFPMHMAWHVRHRQDPAHRWLRTLVAEVAASLGAPAAAAPGVRSGRARRLRA
ncbi:LysR family transcriptional regulator [Piscinibacter sakaiensis]|uniref:Putative LysR family transcriptional regulator n=1 Tax=Piscinibacter sakaiensis TaxID=1547922 RepID=A0A0K8NUI6_PISS1|nr:LysR family transcriptional regulator [Piscinibacter sakaiensis]GAP34061.1 putative LysR family transcriptional regulator [Piscinibacter sakaiensis]